jgi:hypothetical protein
VSPISLSASVSAAVSTQVQVPTLMLPIHRVHVVEHARLHVGGRMCAPAVRVPVLWSFVHLESFPACSRGGSPSLPSSSVHDICWGTDLHDLRSRGMLPGVSARGDHLQPLRVHDCGGRSEPDPHQ